MDRTAVRLNTVGRIAEKVGASTSRVEYIIRTRGLQHVALAGNSRLFEEKIVARVRHELNAIDARRSSGGRDGA